MIGVSADLPEVWSDNGDTNAVEHSTATGSAFGRDTSSGSRGTLVHDRNEEGWAILSATFVWVTV